MPKKLYLDQNVVSNFAKAKDGWQATELGAVVAQGMANGAIEVWPSPAHVLETFLCADVDLASGKLLDTAKLDLRSKIARTILDLNGASRMAASVELLVVKEFVQTLKLISPACIVSDEYIRRAKLENQRTYLGLLGLLAAVRGYDRPEAMGDLLRNKLSTRLAHARYAIEPDAFVDRMIKAAEKWEVTSDDIWADMDKLSLIDIEREIDAAKAKGKKLSAQGVKRLQTNKKDVARAYGAADIGENLGALLRADPTILMTFDFVELAKQWAPITQKLGTSVAVPEAASKLIADPNSFTVEGCQQMLQQLIRAFVADGLLVTSAMNQIILGELELCLAKGEIPAGGPGYDADHAAAMTWADIFITNDVNLETLTRRIAKHVAELTGGKQQMEVVANAKQLAKIIGV